MSGLSIIILRLEDYSILLNVCETHLIFKRLNFNPHTDLMHKPDFQTEVNHRFFFINFWNRNEF